MQGHRSILILGATGGVGSALAAARAAGGARIVLPGTIYNFDPARSPVVDAHTRLVALIGPEPRTPLDVAARETLVDMRCL